MSILSASALSTRQSARRGLAVYFTLLVLLSAPLEVGIIRTHALEDSLIGLAWLAPLMWVPAAASVITRLLSGEGFADVTFRRDRHTRRTSRRMVMLPFLVGGVAYGTAWISGLVEVNPAPLPIPQWAVLIIVLLVVNLVLVPGEEIGWRGFMVTRLVDAGVPGPLVVSGLIWGMWHVPLVLWGGLIQDGPAPVVSTALLLVTTMALGYILARVRLDSGSVWPAVTLHVAWNTVIQVGFDPASAGDSHALWVGETGVLTALTLVAAAIIYGRRPPLIAGRPHRETVAPVATREEVEA